MKTAFLVLLLVVSASALPKNVGKKVNKEIGFKFDEEKFKEILKDYSGEVKDVLLKVGDQMKELFKNVYSAKKVMTHLKVQILGNALFGRLIQEKIKEVTKKKIENLIGYKKKQGKLDQQEEQEQRVSKDQLDVELASLFDDNDQDKRQQENPGKEEKMWKFMLSCLKKLAEAQYEVKDEFNNIAHIVYSEFYKHTFTAGKLFQMVKKMKYVEKKYKTPKKKE